MEEKRNEIKGDKKMKRFLNEMKTINKAWFEEIKGSLYNWRKRRQHKGITWTDRDCSDCGEYESCKAGQAFCRWPDNIRMERQALQEEYNESREGMHQLIMRQGGMPVNS